MDIDKICRTCLGLSGPLLSIFDGGAGTSTADMLRDFTKIKARRADNLPEKVCFTCISEINHCYSFKLKCEQSNRTLRQLLPDALPEDPVEVQPITKEAPPKMHKSVQTNVESGKKTITISREVQTNQTEHKSQHMQTDIDRETSKVVNQDSATSLFKQQQQQLRKKIAKQAKSKATDSSVEVILANELGDTAVYGNEDNSDDDEVCASAVYEELNNDNAVESLIKTETASSSSIILHVADDDAKFTEMIYDESTGELHAATVGEERLNCTTAAPNGDKAENAYNFRIYNNEHGETEIEASSSITTRKQRKAAADAAKQVEFQKVLTQEANNTRKSKRVEKQLQNDAKRLKTAVRKHESPTDYDRVSPQMNFFCALCNAGFAAAKSLAIHQRQKFCTAQVYKCNDCERVFMTEKHLLEHGLTHALYTCSECKTEFQTKDELSKHMVASHKRNMRNQCNVCQKVFTMLSALRDHMRIHTGEKPFVCKVCNKGFTQSANLRQHMFRHSDTKRFKCDQCESSYVTKGELVSHNRTHTGDRPFQCEFCDSKFTTSCSLVKHKRKHTGERPYACDICPMRFTTLNVLKNHRRTHTGEKPYNCPHCPKKFTQKGDCLLHLRTHQIDKTYLCPECGEEFKNIDEMRGHIMKHERLEEKSVHFTILNSSKENIKTAVSAKSIGQTTTADGGQTIVEDTDFMQLSMEDMC